MALAETTRPQSNDAKPNGANAHAFTPPEAFLIALLLAAACDGGKARLRIDLVDEYVRRSPLLRPLGEKGRIALRRAVIDYLAEDNALSAACAAVPEAARESLFAHALDVLIQDTPLSVADEAFVKRLTQGLGIPAARAGRIRDVIVLKNRW